MKLNINHIAELAQVSKGTVSKALNGRARISDATRDRILKLVNELGYQQDATARALALKKTGIIGFLIPHEAAFTQSGNYWSMVLSGISIEAGRRGYHVLVLNPFQEDNLQTVVTQILNRGTVDGLIIGSEHLDKKSFSTLILKQLPFVLLGQHPDFQHFCVDDDNVQGIQSMLTHMIGQGYRRIGALFGPMRYPYVKERHAAYFKTMAEHGITWTATASTEYSTELVADCLNAFMEAHPDMDALFVTSGGEFLMDAMLVLRKRKVQIPSFGLSVYDDYPFLDCMSPPITAVKQPLRESGERAASMLFDLIDGVPIPQQMLRLKNSLVIRESLGEQLEAPARQAAKP